MTVRVGLDRLLQSNIAQLQRRRVGLVTHPAAVRANLQHAFGSLRQAGINVAALFSPEHGFSGAVADAEKIQNTVEASTQVPIYSLYGDSFRPTQDALRGLDILVFDMQDVGARFYTFISTLYYIMEGAAQAGIPVMVLDRPNPLNGLILEGPVLEPEFSSFVGIFPLPVRYGLTMGELARYMNAEHGLDVELTVISMEDWQRSMWFSDTGRPWVPTSPAMPHLSTVTLYPGMCLLEGTNLSEGRGTALPFEICGAPWIDEHVLASAMNELALPGIRFRPTQFIPTAPGKYNRQLCRGVQVHIIDREALRPLTMGLHLIATIKQLYPSDFTWRERSWEGKHAHFDLLIGTDEVRQALDAGVPVNTLIESWKAELTQFDKACQPYRLYY